MNIKELKQLIQEAYHEVLNEESHGKHFEQSRRDMKYESRRLKEANRGKLYPEDCVKDKTYLVGYRVHQWESTFKGWKTIKGSPRMLWEDKDKGTEWEAYMFEGNICVGTSADKLIIYKEV